MASKSPPGLTPIIPVTRCELPVKRASGVASKAKKSASLPVLRRRRGRALSWRKAWIDIQRGGPTGWTNKTCAARRPEPRGTPEPQAECSGYQASWQDQPGLDTELSPQCCNLVAAAGAFDDYYWRYPVFDIKPQSL